MGLFLITNATTMLARECSRRAFPWTGYSCWSARARDHSASSARPAWWSVVRGTSRAAYSRACRVALYQQLLSHLSLILLIVVRCCCCIRTRCHEGCPVRYVDLADRCVQQLLLHQS